ncbi:MAG TPA: orotidine-5'-phosphate decarboxylase [Pyrodictium sp.]|nr:orotidine-5'-phosphate decarboxylase [Pyrodictium sp.]
MRYVVELSLSLIVALDRVSYERAANIVDSLCEVVSGFKVGLPFLLQYGLSSLEKLRSLCSEKMWVADLKLADIGYVMTSIVELLAGKIDAVIAHAFVGYRGALDELKEFSQKLGIKLIVVAAMSHPGSVELYDIVLGGVAKIVERVAPWGIVVPATRPKLISVFRKMFDCQLALLAPGVGVQGARPGDAICAGADYEIVGRLIVNSDNPLETAIRILNEQQRCRKWCEQR